MSGDGLIGVAILVIGAPAFVALVVWVTVIAPRRARARLAAALATLAPRLALTFDGSDRMDGRRDGRAASVRYAEGGRHTRRATVCSVAFAQAQRLSFVVTSPRPGAGGARSWKPGLYVGAPTDDARALAQRVAAAIEGARLDLRRVRNLEVDGAGASVRLDDWVFDPDRLEEALSIASAAMQATERALTT